MTSDNKEVDSLTTQGKGVPEKDVPPQTIIGTVKKFHTGGYVGTGEIPEGARLPLIGERIIPPKVDGGAEGIIPTIVWPDAPASSWKPLADDFFEAEQRRQTVQAEAMVNLAVGVVAMKMSTHHITFTRDHAGIPNKFRISITANELVEFQRDYIVDQQVREDGAFMISVTKKEG